MDIISLDSDKTMLNWVTRFGPKMGQIGPKWEKSGSFSDQISVHFGADPQTDRHFRISNSNLILVH